LSLPSYLLNKENKNDKESRDLSTLITVDAQKVGDYICHMNDIWIIPIQVFINLCFCNFVIFDLGWIDFVFALFASFNRICERSCHYSGYDPP